MSALEAVHLLIACTPEAGWAAEGKEWYSINRLMKVQRVITFTSICGVDMNWWRIGSSHYKAMLKPIANAYDSGGGKWPIKGFTIRNASQSNALSGYGSAAKRTTWRVSAWPFACFNCPHPVLKLHNNRMNSFIMGAGVYSLFQSRGAFDVSTCTITIQKN